ncbi:MAG: PorT family protein [Calditrichaeota bacterium]|nr:PorT family protein [Calditrichota bacterium]
MKYLLFALGALLLVSSSFAAPRFGVKGGLMFGNIDEDIPNQAYTFDTKNRTGMVAGIWGELPLMILDGLAVRGDVLYAQKGAKYEIFNQDVKDIADELTFTPFAVYYLPLPAVRPFFEIGPEVGLTVSDGVRVDDENFNSNGNWKDVNFSLNIGGGVDVQLGKRAVTLEVKFNRGLTNMGNWDSNAIGGEEAKTYGVQLLVGVQLI